MTQEEFSPIGVTACYEAKVECQTYRNNLEIVLFIVGGVSSNDHFLNCVISSIWPILNYNYWSNSRTFSNFILIRLK